MGFYEVIMNETKESLKTKMPYSLKEIGDIQSKNGKLQTEISFITEKSCTLRLIGDEEMFRKLALSIHDIELDGEILQSFIGEFWNLVLGPVIKSLKSYDEKIDISPSKPATSVNLEAFSGDITQCFLVYDWKDEVIGEMALYCDIKKGE